jgi:hypothetical protein
VALQDAKVELLHTSIAYAGWISQMDMRFGFEPFPFLQGL